MNQVGWNTIRIVLIEEVVCENKQQLLQIEDKYIRQQQENILCLNTNSAVRTKEDVQAYKESHKEELNAYQKAYKESHKEELNAYQKVYQKTYKESHKEELNAYYKAYYQAHKKD
jgi:hypothetical protein